MWTDATAQWATRIESRHPGQALYKLLAVLAHPQATLAIFGLSVDAEGNTVRRITLEHCEKVAQLALVSFYMLLTLVMNYCGHRPNELIQWEEELERVLPRIFNVDEPEQQHS